MVCLEVAYQTFQPYCPICALTRRSTGCPSAALARRPSGRRLACFVRPYVEFDAQFQAIGYSEIDLHKTEALLKDQGLLLIDLGWFRARTLMALINEQEKLNAYRASRHG